jgi:hypothetical protein
MRTIALLLLTCACNAPTPTWTPADPTAAVVCRATDTKPWVSTMYLKRAETPGADASLKVNHDGTWVLSEESAPGVFNVPVASGAVDADGALIDLPRAVFDGATAVWMGPGGACAVGGEAVPLGPACRSATSADASDDRTAATPQRRLARWAVRGIAAQFKGDCACE